MRKVQLVTTTATYANKAKTALRTKGIAAEVRKVQGGTAAGCLFGIVVAADDLGRVKSILESENVRIIAEKEVQI